MQLRLDNKELKTAYETALHTLELEIARLTVYLGIDLEALDPVTFSPDVDASYYVDDRHTTDLLMNSLRRYVMVTAKLKELGGN